MSSKPSVREQLEEARDRSQRRAMEEASKALEARRARLEAGLKKIPVNWRQEIEKGTLSGVTSKVQASQEAARSAHATLREILAKAGPMPDGY